MTSVSHYDRATAPDAREDKLPAWAKNRINSLRALVVELHADLERTLLESNPDGSEAVLNPYGNLSLGTGPQGLGQRVIVRWPLREDGKLDKGIDVRVTSNQEWLYLSGDGRLVLEWDATNTCRVRVTR
jgi:hypothetical protein